MEMDVPLQNVSNLEEPQDFKIEQIQPVYCEAFKVNPSQIINEEIEGEKSSLENIDFKFISPPKQAVAEDHPKQKLLLKSV